MINLHATGMRAGVNFGQCMPLYHIFKLIILLFGLIMMFDTDMFLLSFDTYYIGIGWKHRV